MVVHHGETPRECDVQDVSLQPGVTAFFPSKMEKNRTTIWVNYNELTTSSLEIIVSKGNHPQMALIQVSELL